MGSKSPFDFSDNIRTHASVVGVIFTLSSIVPLVGALALYMEDDKQQLYLEEDKKPEIEQIDGLKEFLLALGVIQSFFTSIYWIGFLKHVRWCLAVIIVLQTTNVTLQFISLLGAMLQLSLPGVCIMLIVCAINVYELQVTRQLRTAISECSIPHQLLCA